MKITEIKLDSAADHPTFNLESDQVWTNFYLEADATITQYGVRWAHPDKKVGDTVTVRFGYRAMRGMTDDGQPGWDRGQGDSLRDIEEAIRIAKMSSGGVNYDVKKDTIRLVRVDRRTIVQSQTQKIEIDNIEDELLVYQSSFIG